MPPVGSFPAYVQHNYHIFFVFIMGKKTKHIVNNGKIQKHVIVMGKKLNYVAYIGKKSEIRC